MLSRQIEAVHRLSKGAPAAFDSDSQQQSAVPLKDLMLSHSSSSGTNNINKENNYNYNNNNNSSNAGTGGTYELTQEDEAVLKRWAERDKVFDAKVEEIGKSIDRIGNLIKYFNCTFIIFV